MRDLRQLVSTWVGTVHHSENQGKVGAMINPTRDVRHSNEPFTWHLAAGLLTAVQLRDLEHGQPTVGISRKVVEGIPREKHYRVNVLKLLDPSGPVAATESLSPAWRDLLRDLESDWFTDWISQATNLDLHGLPTQIGFHTYTYGDYVTPHRDKQNKALTAILYLNERWPVDGGGHFEVRRSGSLQDSPVTTVLPLGGQLVAFQPTPSSWHAVSRVDTQHADRLTLVLEYWLPDE